MIRSILARIISVRMEESQVKRKIRGAGGKMDLIILRYGKAPESSGSTAADTSWA